MLSGNGRRKSCRFILIKKNNVSFSGSLVLGIHEDLMPSVKMNRLVIRMTDITAGVNRRIDLHHSPIPTSRLIRKPENLNLTVALRCLPTSVHYILATR